MKKLNRNLKNFFHKHFPHLTRSSKSQSGVALLLATFCLSMILYIAMEVQYETQVEYVVNNGNVARLRAYYNARSGVELSLLRIKMYHKLKAQVAGQPGVPTQMLDLIWSFPFVWPPMAPPEMNAVDQSAIDAIVKESMTEGGYQTVITDEGTRIDINDLDSPSKTIRESTKKLILQMFENETVNNSAFSQRHQQFLPEDLVNNIIDWLDRNREAVKGGDERAAYPDTENMPPNRQFRSLEELRMVAGMTDDIYNLLAPRLTVYGAKAINPNTAPAEVIQGLHSSITNEVVAEVLTRRQDVLNNGQFKDAADFWTFLDSKGARVPKEIQDSTPISTESATNFRIKSQGFANNASAEIELVTYDIPATAKAVAKQVKADAVRENPGSSPTPTPTPAGTTAAKPADMPKGPPRIVFWSER